MNSVVEYYIYVTPFFPSSRNWDGGYCLDYVKALQGVFNSRVECEKHIEVVVMKPGDGRDYEIDGVKVHTFKAKNTPSNIFPFIFKRYNQRSFLKKLESVIGRVEMEKCRICHGNTAEYSIYPLALRKIVPDCKTLLHHHDLSSFGFSSGLLRKCRIYRALQTPILRKLHKQIDCHIFISTVCQRHFVEDAGFEPKHSYVLHNGVDESLFYPLPSTASSSFIIGCVGNFQPLKDQMTILKAVKRVVGQTDRKSEKKIVVKFLGGDSTLGRLQKLKGTKSYMFQCRALSKKLNLQVDFMGERTRDMLPEFYRGLDLFVLPSYFEGFGCVYTEAYACGVPFIACKENNGIADLAPDEWLINRGDDEALARLIERFMNHEFHGLHELKGEYKIEPLVKKFVQEVVCV